ncbi:MAG TPA: uroporphyrinogen-III synthase [Myxococcota bacterium]|nr:uroporphyrinogen-III synthase [Myxococcota bacterium]
MAAHLNGRRVLITREAEKAKALADAVVARGGIPVIFPTIEIAPPKDPKPLHDAVKNLALYDWVAVSSKNGVAALKAALAVTGVHITGAHIDGPRFLAVGEGTAQALEEIGVDNPIFPARQDADGLLALMLTLLTDQDPSHKRALVIRAEVGRDVLIDGLRAAGVQVDFVVGYTTSFASPSQEAISTLLAQKAPEIALFMSPSAFNGLMAILGEPFNEWLKDCQTVAIGAVTKQAMTDAGFPPDATASKPTIEAMLDCIK